MTVTDPSPSSEFHDETSSRWRLVWLVLGFAVFLFLLLAPTPEHLTPAAQRLAAVTALMAIYWVGQPIPIAATSVIPLALYPLLGILPATEVSQAYGDQNIFLYLGGFLIAIGIERWELHRRIALHVISRVGSSPRRIIFGFMLTTALLSMWISNTASTLLMLPIGLALVATLREALRENHVPGADRIVSAMTVPLLLGIAYSASIGGIATLVGTPTNLSFRGFWDRQFVSHGAPELSFAEWMIAFIPMSGLLLVLAAVVMTWKMPGIPRSEQLSRNFFQQKLHNLGRASGAEWRVGLLFLVTALLWILREPLVVGDVVLVPGWPDVIARAAASIGVDAGWLTTMVKDSTIAVAMALLLFILPGNPDATGRRPRLIDWETAEAGIPWGMLLLFGGGFAMADAFSATELSVWMGDAFADVFQGQSTVVLIFGICVMLTFLTEFTSNTATINTLLPILAAMSLELNIDPRLLMIPATVSASCAFMFPVGTPPNAIVFASGRIPMVTMVRYGLILNCLGVLVVTTTMWFWAAPVMQIPLKQHAETQASDASPAPVPPGAR